jgi:hypothetical protein
VVEHTARSRRLVVAAAAAVVVVLVELVVAGAVIAGAAAIGEGVHADVDECASVAQADAYAEVSVGLSQYVSGFGVM